MILRLAVEKSDESTRNSCGRTREAVIDAHLQTTSVEVVEVAVQWSIAIVLLEMLVVILTKSHSEEVAHMTEDDEYKVTDVCCKEIVVWRFIFDWLRKFFSDEATEILVGW